MDNIWAPPQIRGAIAGLIGGFATGVALFQHVGDGQFVAILSRVHGGDYTPAQALPAAAAIPALVVALLLRRHGWLVAAAALLAGAGVAQVGLTIDLQSVTLAALVGVALGGAACAFGQSGPPGRVATATGLAAGFVASAPLTLLIALHSNTPSMVLTLASSGAVCLVAGVLGLSRRRPDAAEGGRGLGTAVIVAALSVAIVGASYGLVAFQLAQVRLVPGGTYDALLGPAAAGVVGIILGVVAALRGGWRLARWVLVAGGVGIGLGSAQYLAQPDTVWVIVVTMVAGAAVGGAAAMVAGRALPWDAIGLAVGGTGLLLTAGREYEPFSPPVAVDLPSLLIGFGLALALGAGLAGLARESTVASGTATPAQETEASAAALGPGPAALSVTTGFAACLLVMSLLLPPVLSTTLPPFTRLIPFWVFAAAVVVLFFVVSRLVAGRPQSPSGPSADQGVGAATTS